ncbi:reticulon-4 receptor-like [Brienomyrus brachyistius]|uniref:reticulon-4 receptor-like n=1 Tax=Brienomyrus brachyistius TaxID=42636 RepID=UPI0020B36965|nr:reticulon-4 receptor-like [Brienomyrus brachyistius]
MKRLSEVTATWICYLQLKLRLCQSTPTGCPSAGICFSKMKTAVVEGGGLLLLALWLQSASAVPGCPAMCVCYDEPRPTLACQQQGLSSIPTEIPERSQRIFLQSNRLTVVRSTSFSCCRNLTVLWLYSNDISHIEAGAFYGLGKLEELDIGDNGNMRIISSTAFRGLTRLHTLHLHRCGLSELPVGVFRGLHSLQYLYLQDNNLLTLHDNTFMDLANLSYLFLHNNKIKTVSDHMLRGLVNLDRLLLHQNRVTFIQQRAFHDLGKLTTLYLFYNNLTVLTGETMEPMASLQYLRLNGNQWICDCRARTLWEWFKRFKGSSSALECHVPASLAGKDLKRLKSSDLEGCVDSTLHTWTGIFGAKAWPGKYPTTEAPLWGGTPRCCLPDSDKSSIISSKGLPDPSLYNSRQITNSSPKEKENIAKTKFLEVDQSENGTRNKQNLNDGPGNSNMNQAPGKVKPDVSDDLESSTDPSSKKKCSKNLSSDTQCPKGKAALLRTLDILILPVLWSSLFTCWTW